MSNQKWCSTCNAEKSLDEFSHNKNKKNGYNNQCRDCINQQRRLNRKEKLYSTMTDEEIIEYENKLNLTTEERKQIKVEKKRIYDIKLRNGMTEKEKEISRVKHRENYLTRIKNMSEEEKIVEKEKVRLKMKTKRDNMTDEEREIQREKVRMRKENRTPEQIEVNNEKKRLKRKNRTPEQIQHAKDVKREWNKNNKEHIKQYSMEREKDSSVRMVKNLRRRIIRAVKDGQGFKTGRSQELIGCDWKTVKNHLESMFKKGMNWDNYGLYGWHIDHRRPCSSFDLTKENEQRECFHYTNLQPLWAYENLLKSDKWNKEVEIESLGIYF